jgi:mono/diheme cytochrome c family protein
VLRGIDTTLEVIAWSLVVFFVILLFAGPRVVAEDKPEANPANASGKQADQDEGDEGAGDEAGREATVDGKTVFSDTCGSCHTLSAAGTSGTTGPNLDDVSLDAAAIEGIVRDGRGGMPAFGDQLSDEEIAAVAEFVAGN